MNNFRLLGIFLVLLNFNLATPWQNAKQAAFDTFIQGHISDYLTNLQNGSFIPNNFDFATNISTGYANGSSTNARLDDIRLIQTSMTSSIGTGAGVFDIAVNTPKFNVSGIYHLQGLAENVIIVNGDGNFTIEVSAHMQLLSGSLYINGGTGISFISGWGWTGVPTFGSINSTFNGIVGDDIIGELIKNYLSELGLHVFRQVERQYFEDFYPRLQQHLNGILSTITIDEILNGATAGTTSTASPTTGVTQRPDVILDVIGDLSGSGWDVPEGSSCGYAAFIDGFLCNGSPISVRYPISGTGFWMNPCPGLCKLHYGNGDGRVLSNLGVRNTHNEDTSRIIVDFEHDGGLMQLQLFRSHGVDANVHLSMYNRIRNLNVTLENLGAGRFAVLDRLSLSFS